MPSEFTLPPSLGAATDLIFDFMRRDERADGLHTVRSPILLFAGPRSSGKTQVLYRHRDRTAGTYPCAYLDGEWPLTSTWEMLLLLAFELKQLNEHSEYGALAFPRLTAGEIVITAELSLSIIPEAARKQVSDLLATTHKTKGVLEDTITALAKGLAQSLGAVSQNQVATDIAAAMADLVGKYAVESLLGAMAKRNSGRRALFGPGLEWWGDQGRGLGNQPIDNLVRLRRDADLARSRLRGADSGDPQGNRDARARVTGQLWSAFLADLRSSFANPEHAVNWTRNCVVLLDNAETAVARLFLTELRNERDKRHDQPDPLTVVVTSRGGLKQPVRLGGLTPLADASCQHYRDRPVPEAGKGWYPIALSGIDWHETGEQLATLELAVANSGQLTTAVHALADGHLGATCTLVAALAEQPHADGEVDMTAVLAAPEPATFAAGQRAVHEAILESLLASLDPATSEAVDDLATCAAARHREAARRLAMEPSLMRQLPSEEEGTAGEAAAIFTSEFWRPDPAGVPAFLYPVLRRLLLWRLAARPPGDTATWTQVHAWLRRRARAEGKDEAALYHTLALAGSPPREIAEAVAGDESDPLARATPLEYVTRQLAGKLPDCSAREWLSLVACVTAAPNRLDHAKAPREHVRTLTAWANRDEPVGAVARYVVRSWIGADPLSAPHWRQLLREMAKELDLLAPNSDDVGLTVLRDEAERYREIAGFREGEADWREISGFWMTRIRTADDANRKADQ